MKMNPKNPTFIRVNDRDYSFNANKPFSSERRIPPGEDYAAALIKTIMESEIGDHITVSHDGDILFGITVTGG